jgi:hypothetical protein
MIRGNKNNTSKFSLNYLGRNTNDTSSKKGMSVDRFTHLFADWKKSIGSSVGTSSGVTTKSSFGRKSPKGKKILYIALSIVSIILVILIVRGLVGNGSTSSDTKVSNANDITSINKEFSFPLRNENGEEVSSFKYLIENAELRDEIIVKGQKATAIKGRDFLILTLKLQNDLDDSIEVSTKDYLRLSVNGNEDEWLAPDIHNDPVEVQAISVKNTRLGFPVNENDKNLVIQVGEINGDKEKIEINF